MISPVQRMYSACGGEGGVSSSGVMGSSSAIGGVSVAGGVSGSASSALSLSVETGGECRVSSLSQATKNAVGDTKASASNHAAITFNFLIRYLTNVLRRGKPAQVYCKGGGGSWSIVRKRKKRWNLVTRGPRAAKIGKNRRLWEKFTQETLSVT